jgi:hypothetical protein
MSAEESPMGKLLVVDDVPVPTVVTVTQPRTHNRCFGDAAAALLDEVLFIRSTVPSTFPRLDVAARHVDIREDVN